MSLEKLIRQRIKKYGPMTLADYMDLALSHPQHGYYMQKDPLGEDGDFITAPEISQVFGELIGAWLAEQWQCMEKPEAALVELGPGRGTLMADLLRATKNVAGFHGALSVHLVEISPALKSKQWQALAGKHPQLRWHETIDELPDKPWLVVANEFFDALPIRQFFFKDKAWHERMVGIENGHLAFLWQTCKEKIHSEPTKELLERCDAGIALMRRLAAHIKKYGGAAMIVDYGYVEGSKGDTLQAVKAHHYHDPLLMPGGADLTAHVDFAALKEAAESAGAKVYGPVPQGRLLMQLGAGARIQQLCAKASGEQAQLLMAGLERLASPDKMGDLFKALAICAPDHPKPEGF